MRPSKLSNVGPGAHSRGLLVVGVCSLALAMAGSGCGRQGRSTDTAATARVVQAEVVGAKTPAQPSHTDSTPVGGYVGPAPAAKTEKETADTSMQVYVRAFGRTATAAEAVGIQAVVGSYYGAVLAGAGARACALVTAGLRGQITQLLATASGNKSCAASLPRLLKPAAQLRRNVGVPVVHEVRIKGRQAFVLLSTRASHSSYLPLYREGEKWRVAALLDTPLN